MSELYISTGAVKLDIIRDGENVGVFKFNPKDIGEAERFSEFSSSLNAKRVEYQEKAKALDENGTDVERVKFLADFIRELRNNLDNLYGTGTSQLVFGDALDIDMFFDFMEGIAPYYKKASSERTAKYRKHSSK